VRVTRQWLDSEVEERLEREKAFQRGFAAGRAYQSEKDVEAVAVAMKDWSNVWCVADAALEAAKGEA